MKTTPVLRCLAALLFISLLSSCQTAKMAVPAELETQAQLYPCEGRQGFKLSETFTFGPYTVDKVHRGWQTTTQWGLFSFEHAHARQQFEYSLVAPDRARWTGKGGTDVSRNSMKQALAGGEFSWTLEDDRNYVVSIRKEGSSRAWLLMMGGNERDTAMNGRFSNGKTAYTIEGSHKLAGSSFPLMDPSGYLIYNGRKLVAAVDLLNAGSVYLDNDLPQSQRDALAAAATALLLHKEVLND